MNSTPDHYEWRRDWREGAAMFAFIAGCYLALVILAGFLALAGVAGAERFGRLEAESQLRAEQWRASVQRHPATRNRMPEWWQEDFE